MTDIRVAAAPISWGVSEVPGWGHQIATDRVLDEMAELGFRATELGPDGFLPVAPVEKAATLRAHGLTGIASFVPLVLHRDGDDPLPRVRQELDAYRATGSDVLVVCAVTGAVGYDDLRAPLTEAERARLFDNLDRIAEIAAAEGVTAAIHPHVGSVVETAADVRMVAEGSSMPFCFDTGHLMIGGTDPTAFAAEFADRIAHTHLKDVSIPMIERVKAGELSYYDACVEGLYTPLGEGDVDVRAIVDSLLDSGYRGWFVLEQDTIVAAEPAPGEGPRRDAGASLRFLQGVVGERES